MVVFNKLFGSIETFSIQSWVGGIENVLYQVLSQTEGKGVVVTLSGTEVSHQVKAFLKALVVVERRFRV